MNDGIRSILLVTQYDGAAFAGWQRQSNARTVQEEMESVLARIGEDTFGVTGAGRTDAGVHAHGQGVGVRVSAKWNAPTLRRAMNAYLPPDIWIANASEMQPEFHARYSATARRYGYLVGTDDAARSPFRRRFEWTMHRPLDGDALAGEAAALLGEHTFRAFAVTHTAPADDPHHCRIHDAQWRVREGGWVFEIEANRFLHHMVRFLIGTMIDVASGKRPRGTIARLLVAPDNSDTSAPAPAHGLSLQRVTYPASLYVTSESAATS